MSDDDCYSDNRPPEAAGETSPEILMHPAISRIMDILSDRHRRLILLSLKDGAVKTEADLMVRGGSDTEETEIALTHSHLPKLEEAGYVEWDPDSGEISAGPRFDEIEPFIDLIENHASELPPDWP